jgi:hypothetical protein
MKDHRDPLVDQEARIPSADPDRNRLLHDTGMRLAALLLFLLGAAVLLFR